MHAKAVDALLVRLLITLTGATLGAVAGASVVFLLRTWRIWSVSPTMSTLSSIGGACVFGALWSLLMRAGLSDQAIVLSRARRRALIVAMALFIATAGGLLVVTTISALTALHKVTFPPHARSHVHVPRGRGGNDRRSGADHDSTDDPLV